MQSIGKMKESRFYNLLLAALMLLMCFISLLDKENIGVPSVDYAVYGAVCALGVLCGIRYRHFSVPRNYILLLIAAFALMVINAAVSKYNPGTKYFLIGAAITLMPFVLFVITYNFSFTDSQIHNFLNIFLIVFCFYAFIVYLDSFVLHTTAGSIFQTGILSSGIVFFGYFSSLCNQALAIALAEFYRTRRKQYALIAAFLVVTIILTTQIKAILGMVLVFTIFVYYLTEIKPWVKTAAFVVGLVAIIAVLSVSASFMLKVEHYLDSNTSEDAYSSIARPALYFGAIQIASDYFPLGSGQGTYGSVPVNLVGSNVYADYGLDKVWGLGDNTDFSFRMDAHWASILGEMGWLGFAIYLMLFFYPARHVAKRLEGVEEKTRKCYVFIIRAGILTLFAESIVLALPKNFAFMTIYAGLAGLIFNRKEESSTEII